MKKRAVYAVGDYGAAGRIGERSQKLAPFRFETMSILLRFPDGSTARAGHLKRGIASMLTPIVGAGAALSGRIYRLYPG